MLVDVNYNFNPIANLIANINGNSSEVIKHETGIYEIGCFNFDHMIINKIEKYPDLGAKGVNIQNIGGYKGRCNQLRIKYKVVRIWKNKNKDFERYIKKQKNTKRYCPICNEKPMNPKYKEKT